MHITVKNKNKTFILKFAISYHDNNEYKYVCTFHTKTCTSVKYVTLTNRVRNSS